MAMSINTIAKFGTMIIHKLWSKHYYIQKKVIVWYDLWAGEINGQYAVKGDDDQNVTDNS